MEDASEISKSPELYSDQTVQDIIIASYDISQQDPEMQRNLLLWIGQQHPDWRMSDETRDRLNTSVLAQVKQMLGGSEGESIAHAAIPEGQIVKDVQRQVNKLQWILNQNRDEVDTQFNQSQVLSGLIDRDYRFLHRKAGRISRVSS